MTRIEKVMSEYGKIHTKKMIMQYCPGNWILGAPKLDSMSIIIKRCKRRGCRGKTCKECWSEEAAND